MLLVDYRLVQLLIDYIHRLYSSNLSFEIVFLEMHFSVSPDMKNNRLVEYNEYYRFHRLIDFFFIFSIEFEQRTNRFLAVLILINLIEPSSFKDRTLLNLEVCLKSMNLYEIIT